MCRQRTKNIHKERTRKGQRDKKEYTDYEAYEKGQKQKRWQRTW